MKPKMRQFLLLCATLTLAAAQNEIDIFNTKIWPALKGGGAPAGTFQCQAFPEDGIEDSGIYCDVFNTPPIAAIYFEAEELAGSLPTELGQLSDAYILYLSLNELTGTIPTQLESWEFLGLDLTDNKL